jgi:arylsulfatase A-like enzyme
MPPCARPAVVSFAACILLTAIGCGVDVEAGSGAAAAHGTSGAAPTVARQGAPNVLLVVVDTLRADHLDLYGYARPTAPRLAEMAAGGVTFSRASSQAPTTVPSHATMFTGRYKREHLTESYETPLPPSELTLAELFAAQGWRTFGVAASRRFDEGSGFRQGFETFEMTLTRDGAARAADVTRLATPHLAASDGRPFFGFVHYMQPHLPYDPPEALVTRFHPGLPDMDPEQTGVIVGTHSEGDPRLPAETVAWLEALYDAELLSLDEQLGLLFDALAESGEADNTLLVLTSDHGEEFLEHGQLSHRQLYGEVLEVPLVMRWPDGLPAGTRVDRPVELAGLFPTLMDLLELPIPPQVSGRSFANELRPGSERDPQDRGARHKALAHMDVVFAEASGPRWAVSATLPTGRFKLIHSRHGRIELYQLDEDPGEENEVAWAFPREVGLLAELAASMGSPGDAQERSLRALDDEARAWLIELGYVEEAR